MFIFETDDEVEYRSRVPSIVDRIRRIEIAALIKSEDWRFDSYAEYKDPDGAVTFVVEFLRGPEDSDRDCSVLQFEGVVGTCEILRFEVML